MNVTELKTKKREELQASLLEKREELFKLRMQRGSGQLAKPDQMKKARRAIARIKTLINEQPKGDN